MKRLLLTAALALLASSAFAGEYTIKEISDPAGDRPYYFSPDKLTIQPGDTVTFVNAQEDMHNVMFNNVPRAVDEMIMSPMFEKEGQKWSYTFTIPGTYQFHCHPHEELGMKGALIVGEASKPGETKKISHPGMAENAARGDGHADHGQDVVRATGRINSVDMASHSINVTHDPIKALGWPKMKMEFLVDQSIDLSGFRAGDPVLFTLKPAREDDYTVIILKKGP